MEDSSTIKRIPPKKWCVKVYANSKPDNVLVWRRYIAEHHNINLAKHASWSADGYINQDGWWFNEFEDLFISSIENEITLDEFIEITSFIKKIRLWKIKAH